MARRKQDRAVNLVSLVNAAFSSVILLTVVSIEHRLTALETQVYLIMQNVKLIQKAP